MREKIPQNSINRAIYGGDHAIRGRAMKRGPDVRPRPAPTQIDAGAFSRKKSRPVSRVLSGTVIPLGRTSPSGSSDLPGNDAGRAIVPLFDLAPGGVCRAARRCPRARCALTAPFHHHHAPRKAVRLSALCCTFRRLAPPRRYLAPCPVEPGLSSARLRATRLSGRLRHQNTEDRGKMTEAGYRCLKAENAGSKAHLRGCRDAANRFDTFFDVGIRGRP